MKSFPAALAAAAEKCGLDVSTVRWTFATLDATWGDLCGFVFHGGSDELNARAARFFCEWYGRRMPRGSYDAQSACRLTGKHYFSEWSNGAKSWGKGELPAAPAPTTLPGCGDFVLERLSGFDGYGVATTYYPCAD